jgi:hypothetical protein
MSKIALRTANGLFVDPTNVAASTSSTGATSSKKCQPTVSIGINPTKDKPSDKLTALAAIRSTSRNISSRRP